MTRASVPRPATRYASASWAWALYIVASSPPSTQISTSRISAGMWSGTRFTNSLSAAAAAAHSSSAMAAFTASSTHWKPASTSVPATAQPTVTR